MPILRRVAFNAATGQRSVLTSGGWMACSVALRLLSFGIPPPEMTRSKKGFASADDKTTCKMQLKSPHRLNAGPRKLSQLDDEAIWN